jgi:hypothetical protein
LSIESAWDVVNTTDDLEKAIGSPWAIALQVGLLVAVCLLPLVNWRRFLDRTTKP